MHRGEAHGAAACLAAIAIAAGCGGGSEGVTYYKDVLPIVVKHCGGCHAPGELAPFSLMTYDDARTYAGPVAVATKSGSMPPWPPAPGCGEFMNTRRLSAAEIATFAAWNDAGAPAGNPTDAPANLTPPGTNLGVPSATLDPGVDYQPNRALTDDYHCFLVDPGLIAAHDLVGFDIHPGTPASVHHVLLFAVPPALLAATQAKDAAEPGPGWTCFGGSGIGSPPNVPAVVGGWVPGSGGTAFPPPTGINLAAGTQIIIQVHYNLLAQRDFLDRTTADLYYADSPVTRPALVRPLGNTTFVVPPGVASQTVAAELPVMMPGALRGVVPHMHLHGTQIKLSVEHPEGGSVKSTCAIDIPRWDFHWQQFYYYVNPLLGTPGDALRLECTYDNSTGTAPLTWGEATTDEMCLIYLYVTAP